MTIVVQFIAPLTMNYVKTVILLIRAGVTLKVKRWQPGYHSIQYLRPYGFASLFLNSFALLILKFRCDVSKSEKDNNLVKQLHVLINSRQSIF